jgi:hypothetical protein
VIILFSLRVHLQFFLFLFFFPDRSYIVICTVSLLSQERLRDKKEKDKKAKQVAKEKHLEQNDAQLKARLKKAEESGAMTALLKLDQTLKARCMRTQDLFHEFDADKDGDLDIDEFMEVYVYFYTSPFIAIFES